MEHVLFYKILSTHGKDTFIHLFGNAWLFRYIPVPNIVYTFHRSCKYNDKTIEHGKQAYEDVCGKLECQDGNLAWYYWPNADYFEECHVPPPLSHGHRQHNMNIPVHAHTHAIHAVGLPCDHGHLHLDPFCHSHPEPHLHIDPHRQHSMPVNVHINHVHHPEHVEVPTLHETTGHTIGHPMGSWGTGHAPLGLGF